MKHPGGPAEITDLNGGSVTGVQALDGSVIDLERHVAGGEVLGRDASGRVVLVRGGLPGESVRLGDVVDHRSWSRAVATEVLVASNERVEIGCASRLEGCGGCDWMHLDPTRWSPAKVEVAAETLARLGGLGAIEPVAGGSVPARHYRTTVRVVGTPSRRAGFRRERSNDPVDASPCLVTHRELQRIISEIEIDPDTEVELRVSAATSAATARLVAGDGAIGLPAGVDFGDEAALFESVAGASLRVSAGSFFQSGPAAAELLVSTVRALAPELDDAAVVLDAYGGVGLFAATTTSEETHVVVVESSPTAAADARANLEGRSAEVLGRRFDLWRHRGRPFDVAIVDPARSGLKRAGVRALVSAGARVVVLISCDVAAGARDLKLLGEAGYRVEEVRVLDLFPQTHHLEMVTRLVRSSADVVTDLRD